MTKNRAPTPVYLDPGMHLGLEVKGLTMETKCFLQFEGSESETVILEFTMMIFSLLLLVHLIYFVVNTLILCLAFHCRKLF